jgi:hypothetical protein
METDPHYLWPVDDTWNGTKKPQMAPYGLPLLFSTFHLLVNVNVQHTIF